jgi:PAS domain S-box-containing protein
VSELAAIGEEVVNALERVSVPSYVIDAAGVIRWLNPAARRLVGDRRGKQFTSIVTPDQRRHSRDVFAQKLAGTRRVTDASAAVIGADGGRIDIEVSSVPLLRDSRVVGVFGQVTDWSEEADATPHPQLTPRQAEVLRLLEQGRSTAQIASQLHLSQDTVRNHVRHLLRALGVNSRLQAVAAARQHRSGELSVTPTTVRPAASRAGRRRSLR